MKLNYIQSILFPCRIGLWAVYLEFIDVFYSEA